MSRRRSSWRKRRDGEAPGGATTSVLFVCLGNICRSATAEGVFRHLIDERSLDGRVTVDSCGTSDYHVGSPPDTRMAAAAQRHGVTLGGRARAVGSDDFDRFDRIIAMDRANQDDLARISPADDVHKIGLLRSYDDSGAPADVPDPYYEGNFDAVFTIIERCCTRLLDELTARTDAQRAP